MQLIVAEKPDQGAKLAAPFPHRKQKGYIELAPHELFPNGAIVTWAIGHLCELKNPDEYDEKWKRWSVQTLPIIPEQFQYKVSKGKRDQFGIIKHWVQNKDITEIIHAGDAEREGEAIVRIILELCRNRKPIKRLWISSLTTKSVITGFQKLLNDEETYPLYEEARARAIADWLVGMNASRIYSLAMQSKGARDVFSCGRVQTPTLALIVKREREIQKFKSEPFWEVNGVFEFGSIPLEAKWHKNGESRINSGEMAEKIAAFCREKEVRVTEIERETKTVQPPFLFNLSSLQAEANRRYKFSPERTLQTAQKLYVKGMISYPRSDSSFVTKEEAKEFPNILRQLARWQAYAPYFPLAKEQLLEDKRYVNEKKVTDHYAIIPTENVPNEGKLTGDEAQLYDLIVRAFLAAHCDVAKFQYDKIHTIVDERATFISKGRVTLQSGWRDVFRYTDNEKTVELPALEEGAMGMVQDVTVKEGKTEPPKRYTEGQLITIMKTAGKFLEDRELSKVLQGVEGLGTEATRAGIIRTLKERNYIAVSKNIVSPTDKGMMLVDAVDGTVLASAEMTAKWEKRLHEIGEGQASGLEFIENAKKLSMKLISDALEHAPKWDFSNYAVEEIVGKKRTSPTVIGKCQVCDGNVKAFQDFYACEHNREKQCGLIISKKILKQSITQKTMKQLLTGHPTDILSNFQKGDRTFAARLQWDWQGKKLNFIFEEAPKQG